MAQTFDPAADGCIDAQGIGLQHEAADQVRVDPVLRFHRAPGCLLDLLHDALCLVIRELDRCRQLDVQAPFVQGDEAIELARDFLDLADPALLRDESQEVAQQLVVIPDEVLHDLCLHLALDLRAAEYAAQLRDVAECSREVVEPLADLVEPVFLLGGLEQGARVRAVDGGYFAGSSSRSEKSRSLIASSIKRR